MDIANNWTIVIGITTVISMTLYWSNQAYLSPIIKREEHIKNKVKDDINKKVKELGENIEIAEQEQEALIEEIYDILEIKKVLRELKETFGRKMVPIGILICIFSIGLVSIWESYSSNIFNILFFITLFSILIFSDSFNKMRQFENHLSRYLEGEDPTDIIMN